MCVCTSSRFSGTSGGRVVVDLLVGDDEADATPRPDEPVGATGDHSTL